VFTSDAGFIWCNDWYNNPNYQKIFSQIVRYSMRPVTEDANFTVGTDIRDNKVRVVVTAVDPNDDFINFLNLNARGIQPDGQGFDLNFSQSAPGRYEAEFDTNNSGNYLFSISPGEGYERLTSGINVPFATEYADRETNQPLIDNWVALPAKDGTLNGMQASPLTTVSDLEQPLQLNPFRMGLLHAATIQAMWPFMLLLAGWIFLTDVFIRRVAVNLNWVSVAAGWVREKVTGKEQPNLQSNMERLRSKKSEVTRQLERARSDMRFEVPDSDRTTSGTEQLTRVLESERDREIEAPAPKSVQNVETPNADLPHTSRLLDAKRRAQQDRSKKDP
jgi:hypothetical protein